MFISTGKKILGVFVFSIYIYTRKFISSKPKKKCSSPIMEDRNAKVNKPK